MAAVSIDPDETDSVGQSVFWSELAFEMSRTTKMLSAVTTDLE